MTKFTIINIPVNLQPLTTDMFSTEVATVFATDDNKHNVSARLATFDSIHDFKKFSVNPIDIVEYQRQNQQYNINRCFFNFNRIMCRGAQQISVDNSFLTKPKGANPITQQAYDNKPKPITSIANVEDYFCLLNLYNIVNKNENNIFIIKSNKPSTSAAEEENKTKFKSITEKIIENDWCDIIGNTKYINTITDVSPFFRKYYIKPNDNKIIDSDKEYIYRALISQETANDPAGSLGFNILTGAFKKENVLIEKESQSRTYKSTKNDDAPSIDSFFEPTLGGIKNFTDANEKINFNMTLTLKDISTFNTLALDVFTIPYSQSSVANPNERTVIKKEIDKIFKPLVKSLCNAARCTGLQGRDDTDHNKANAFYPAIDAFSKEQNQKKIARHFTRKRLGDVLQASLCRLINCNYVDGLKRIKFKNLESETDIIPKTAIFIGEDRMIIAFCLINQIPCIYDNKEYTILYLPNKPTTQYSDYATIPAPVLGGGPINQTGGVKTRAQYIELYGETLWDEPYYFFKILPFIQNIVAQEKNDATYDKKQFLIEFEQIYSNINKKIIDNIYEDNVFNLYSTDKTIPMYYVSPLPVAEEVAEAAVPPDMPIIVAQNIVNIEYTNAREAKFTFINVFNENKYTGNTNPVEPHILLSVSNIIAPSADDANTYRDIYFRNNIPENIDDQIQYNFRINKTEFDRSVEHQFEVEQILDNETINETAGGAVNNDLYSKNVKTLQNYFYILKKYEIYSIMDEKSNAYFYDINNSGVRVAFDSFFYVFFNNLISEFEAQSKIVFYDLLNYYLFKYKKDLYIDFNEIISFGSDKNIILDDTVLDSLTEDNPTIIYLNNLLERSIIKRDEINIKMSDFFTSSKYVSQYNCAIENKFTHYGFSTIKNDFENIINANNHIQVEPIAEEITAEGIKEAQYNKEINQENEQYNLNAIQGGKKKSKKYKKHHNKTRNNKKRHIKKSKKSKKNKKRYIKKTKKLNIDE